MDIKGYFLALTVWVGERKLLAVFRLDVTPVTGQMGCQGPKGVTSGPGRQSRRSRDPEACLHPRSARGWLDVQHPLVSGGADVRIRGLSGAGRQCRPLTCPVLPQLGTGFSDEELEEYHQTLQVSRRACVCSWLWRARALGATGRGQCSRLWGCKSQLCRPLASAAHQSGAPSPRAQSLGRSRRAVSGEGALVGFPKSILGVLAELLLSGGVCGHGHRCFGCDCLLCWYL